MDLEGGASYANQTMGEGLQSESLNEGSTLNEGRDGRGLGDLIIIVQIGLLFLTLLGS
jgi:hypothetical protein